MVSKTCGWEKDSWVTKEKSVWGGEVTEENHRGRDEGKGKSTKNINIKIMIIHVLFWNIKHFKVYNCKVPQWHSISDAILTQI